MCHKFALCQDNTEFWQIRKTGRFHSHHPSERNRPHQTPSYVCDKVPSAANRTCLPTDTAPYRRTKKSTDTPLIRSRTWLRQEHSVIHKERSISWEVTVSVVVRNTVDTNICLILNELKHSVQQNALSCSQIFYTTISR
jgi:hypothetical protein